MCHRWAEPVLTAFVAIAVIASFLLNRAPLECRQTNVDLVAARLLKEAAPNDYIIVNPWYFGVSLTLLPRGRRLDDVAAAGRPRGASLRFVEG